MNHSIYLEHEFWGLILCTIILPAWIFIWLARNRKFSRLTLTTIGVMLVTFTGLDVIFLRRLSDKAKATATLMDDRIFSSEISIALYIIPMILAGIGVNLISYVLCEHLSIKELENTGDSDD